MTNNYDRSAKDKKYFIDGSTYNCPFCKRRHIKYKIVNYNFFHSSNTKTLYFYIIRCEDCDKTSFHLSKYELKMENWRSYYQEKIFTFPLKQLVLKDDPQNITTQIIETEIVDGNGIPKELDDVLFYNLPTSFFTIDERIPKSIREPLSEAVKT